MKRIATLMLVMVFALVGTMAAKPQCISPQENARQSKKDIKKHQKMLNKANKKQAKAMRKAAKAQRKQTQKANRQNKHR